MTNNKAKNKEKPLLLLFDGNALVHRAFHALPPLTTSRTGEMINAVYGFANTLLKVLTEFKPTYWAVAFDRPTPTFRHEMFKEYKAQRPVIPEELKNQIKRVHQLVDAFHIPTFEIDGFEADDILGTLSQRANEYGIETIIVTGDNDMLQLVTPGVKALAPKRAFNDTALYDAEAVKRKYGIKPEQITDFKALVGDTSDNIPGIPGIGAKTATKLIQQHGSLEEIYAHIEDIMPSRLQMALRQYQSQAFQSKELVTIVRDVPIELNLESCRVSHYDRNEVAKLFQELEFIKLLPRLPNETRERTSLKREGMHLSPTKDIYQIVNTEAGLERLIGELEAASEMVIGIGSAVSPSFSLGGSGFNGEGLSAGLVEMAISPARGRAFYIPLRLLRSARNDIFGDNDTSGQLPPARVIVRLKPLLEGANIGKIAHNGKYVMEALANCGVEMENLNFDTMIAAYLLGEKNLTLESLAFSRLGVEMISPGKLTDSGKKQSPGMMETKQLVDYACANANVIWSLRDSLQKELQQQGLWQLFAEVEMPLIPVLAAMEENGIALDTRLLREMSLELGSKMLKLELEIYNSVGHKFNINSPKQLARVLFEELRLPQSRKRKSSYSTEAAVLEELTGLHPVIEFILEYRQLSKLKSTYVDALPALINPKTGRVHTTFNQAGTTTGRLSSSEPNLQNIPIRGGLGNKIRRAIIASPGSYLLSADYSQIDLRVLAHLSRDTGLITAFASGEDIHAMTASKLFGIPIGEVSPEMRRAAKTVNFGVIYGMSDYGLEQATNFSREEAAQFINLYFERYPKVREYIKATKEQARKQGYVQTVMGRRRFIPEIGSPNRQVRETAERMAINAPVQGSSADIIKVAMINLHREMKKRKLKSKMLLQIHDELIFEVPQEEVEEMKSLVTKIMTRAIELCVPLKVDIKIGKNLGEMINERGNREIQAAI
jgi:DNA polymerase-1